jgi:hypothetical protein
MKYLKHPLIFLAIFSFPFSCLLSQGNLVKPLPDKSNEPIYISRDDVCIEYVELPAFFKEKYLDLPIYTGTEKINEIKSIIIDSNPTVKWVKKRADANCISANPDDCLIWCQVNEPNYKQIQVLTDTIHYKDFVIQNIKTNALIRPEGKYKIEKVCSMNISSELIHHLQSILALYGLETGPLSNKLNSTIRKAIREYQEENGFPVGQLDLETLKSLNVFVKKD